MIPLLLLLGQALAGVDAHGPLPPASDGDPARPLRVTSGQAVEGGSAAVLGEYANEPLNLFVDDGTGDFLAFPQLEHVGLANLQLAQGFGPVALTAVVPLAPLVDGDTGYTPAVADPRLGVRLTVLDGERGGITLAPTLRLPLGPEDRFLGAGGLSGGLQAAGTLLTGPLSASLEAGVESAPVTRNDRLEYGGTEIVGGASVGGVWPELGLGAHLEAVGAIGLAAATGSPAPLELTGSVRGAHGPLWWAVGGGTGLTEGIGSAAVRLFAGAGVRWGQREPAVDAVVEDDPAPEELVEPAAVDPTPVRIAVTDVRGGPVAASVVGFHNGVESIGGTEGLPARGGVEVALQPGEWVMTVSAPGFGPQQRRLDVGANPIAIEAILLERTGDGGVALQVTDAEGAVAEGARVLVDGLPVGDVGQSKLLVSGLSEGEHEVAVRGHGFVGWKGFLGTGADAADVVLYPVEGTLRVEVVDPEGNPVPDAFVAFDGPSRRPSVPMDGARERSFVLSPGTWTALVTSASKGIQSRQVILEEDAWTTAVARFVLGGVEGGPADLRVRVVDVEGLPVEGARVRWQETPLGQTASGGDLQVRGLGLGAGDLAVEVDGAVAIPLQELVLQPGLQEAWITVRWLPGTVWLRVRHPDGPVGDAVVLAAGPESRAPLPLGPTGTATLQLTPGTWELAITSAQWGMASREVALPEDAGARARVDVVLMPVGNLAGSAVLDLSVVDPEASPVVGAAVSADALPLGHTSTGPLKTRLTPGTRTVEVQADGYRPWTKDVILKPGPNAETAALDWRSMVHLEVQGPDGQPAADATVRLVGSRTTAPIAVGADGSQRIPADPGTWQALAVSAEHGIATAFFEVPSGVPSVDQVIRIGADRPQVVVEVRDGLGRPVPEATASCDGCEAVPGPRGLVGLSGLSGPTEVAVRAPHHREIGLLVDPALGALRLAVLEAVPVPVRVSVLDPEGRPVAATIRFSGPQAVAPTLTGPDGSEQIAVIPGDWAVTAEAPGFGVRRRDVRIEPGAETLRVDFSLAEARVSVEGGAVRFDEKVPFDLGSAVLRDGSDTILREVADTLVAHPELALVEVQGHSDATGDLAFNQQLSEDRAAAVRDALVRLGVAPSRLVARGYGPTRPLDEGTGEAALQRNRRVQFQVLESAVQ